MNACTCSYYTALFLRVTGVETSGSDITVLIHEIVTNFSGINQRLLSRH